MPNTARNVKGGRRRKRTESDGNRTEWPCHHCGGTVQRQERRDAVGSVIYWGKCDTCDYETRGYYGSDRDEMAARIRRGER